MLDFFVGSEEFCSVEVWDMMEMFLLWLAVNSHNWL